MKKNIIIMSCLDLWSLEEGKGAPSFYNTVKGYVDNGWNVYLIQPFSKYRYNYKIKGCKMLKFNNTFVDCINKIPKIRFFLKFLTFYYVTHQFYKKAKEIIQKDKNKYIIYSYEVHAVKAGAKLANTYGLPFVTRFQGTILTEKTDNIYNRTINFPHYGSLKQKSDIVIMTDDGTKGDIVLSRLGNSSNKVLFWKNGQDQIKSQDNIKSIRLKIREKYKIKNDAPVLLTVSRLKNWKRVDRAIRAMKVIIKECPDAKLIIVGSGEEYDNLNDLVRDLGLESTVIFTGGIKQEEVWKYYCCADIFLSLYDLSNVGNPLMEAMRYGKAILTLDNGGTKSIINNNNGVLVSPSKLKTIPGEIIKLIKNEKKRIVLGENAFNYANDNFWSWEKRIQAELTEVKNLIDWK